MLDKSDILEVVKKYIKNTVADIDDIDPDRSMVDYGANSLDIVEIVSRVMRELKIKVPRAELTNISNITGLVDVLYKYEQEK